MLLVVGGFVVGTAISWVIGSSTAAADSWCETLGRPALSTVICRVEPILPESPAVDVGRDLVDPLGALPPVPVDVAVLGRSDRLGADGSPGGGTHGSPSLVRPVGEVSAAAPASPASTGPPRSAATGFADTTASPAPSRAGARSPGPPAPVVASTPAAPPSTGHSGSCGGANPAMFAALPGNAGRVAMTAVAVPRARDVPPATRPGAQPGVTPD